MAKLTITGLMLASTLSLGACATQDYVDKHVAPVQAQVNLTNGTVSAPSAADPTDPSSGTFYDFLEFTVTNKAGVPNLDVDTSQVDSFGSSKRTEYTATRFRD